MKKPIRVLMLGFLLTASTITTLLASTATFQQGVSSYWGVQDTSLYYYDSSTSQEAYSGNYGASADLSAGYYQVESPLPSGYWWATGSAVSLIRFDVSSLAGQSVTSASLYLYLRIPDQWADLPVGTGFGCYLPWYANIRPVPEEDSDWVAGSSTGTAESGASCYGWKSYATRSWATTFRMCDRSSPHGNISGVYTGNELRYDGTGGPAGVFREACFTLPTDLIATWASSPTPNGGFAIYGDEHMMLPGGINYIASSETPYQELRPLLEVTYVPEPSCLLCTTFGVAPLAWIVTRRRRYARSGI